MDTRDIISKIVMKAMIAKGHHDLKSMRKLAVGAHKKNEDLLFKILRTNQNCEYGKKYGFADIKTVEEFREKVPVTTFADYEGYIDRMVENGEENVITSLPIKGYAQTSGSVGQRKYIPLTQAEIDVYTKYTVTRMLAIADNHHKKTYGKGLPLGRGMLTMPGFNPNRTANGLRRTTVPDVAAEDLSFIYPYILTYPVKERFTGLQAEFKYTHMRFALTDKSAIYMFAVFFHEYTEYIRYLKKNWRELCDDIETGTIGELAHATPEVKETFERYVKPMPERAAELRAEFEKGFDETIVKRLWPNMCCLCGIGTSSFTPFAKAMRKYTAGIPYDFSIYGASEGLFAAVDEVDSPKQLMLVESCYYEFNPVDDENTFLALDELEVGKEYEIIITNQAGLYRYRFGDIIRVLGYLDECPYIVFSYRKGQLLSITGEKTTEEHMAAVVKALAKEAGCTIDEWAAFIDVDDDGSHYTLLCENDKGVDLTAYATFADEELKKINLRYGYFQGYVYTPMKIMNQKPGSHDEWTQHKVKTTGVAGMQVKPVRVLDTPEKEEFFLSRLVD